MRRGLAAGLAAISLAVPAACRLPRVPAPQYPTEVVRHGPERLAIAYDDPRRADKEVLLERINRDRVDAGVPPVAYEPRAALVGDLFCLDTAMEGAFGHWDLRGRAPFLRWAQAGGVDFHTENAASYSVSSGRVDRPLAELLLETHNEMMAERPPADGHRRTILDPNQTHVGIGLAVVGGEFRMTEEFTAVAFEWIEIPARPLQAGEWASFAGLVLSGVEIETIEVRYEPPPRPLSLHDLQQRGSYAYPRIVRSYSRRLPEGAAYHIGGRGDFEVKHGRASLGFPLDQGPGHYFVLAYVHRATDRVLRPATAAMITAVP